MNDIHCHLLPGIDDGARDTEEAVAMARVAEAEGVRIIAATPHLRFDHPGVRVAELAARCAELNQRLREEGLTLEVVPAAEVDTGWSLDATDEELRLASYGQRGTDLLVETPYTHLTDTFEDVLFRLQLAGYRILLAHPERNPSFQRDPQRLERLVERDVLLQVTAASIVPLPRRSSSRALGRDLVRDGLAHVIASDLHRPEADGRATIARGAEAAAELAGSARTSWMVGEAPAAIVRGVELPAPPPLESQRSSRGVWRRLMRSG